jgi:hypothetical protein
MALLRSSVVIRGDRLVSFLVHTRLSTRVHHREGHVLHSEQECSFVR